LLQNSGVICAGTAVHANVPPRNPVESEIRDEYNNSRRPRGCSTLVPTWKKLDLPNWRKRSLKHGHLLSEMGGFTVIDPDQTNTKPNEQNGIVLTLDYFKRHRSKALSKIIAILQTTWFRLLIVSLLHATCLVPPRHPRDHQNRAMASSIP
jgi:hypothetical protein